VVSAAASEDLLDHDWLPVVDNRRRVLGGVARAALVRASMETPATEQTAAGLVAGLFGDLVFTLGAMLDGVLGTGKAR
jgi:hypothetical protein